MNKFAVTLESWPIAGLGLVTSRETKRDAIVVHVKLTRGGAVGEGESFALKRFDHTPEKVKAACELWLQSDHHWSRDVVEQTMLAGPARHAIDTALWRLEAAEQGKSLAEYVGIANPRALPTAFTLSGGTPDYLGQQALGRHSFRWLKIKLMGDGLDEARLRAIHVACPDKDLIVDANESLTPQTLENLLPVFLQCRVVLIEQPLPEGKDEALLGWQLPILVAADESCHSLDDLESLRGKYQVVNLKLDKTGGLTHALKMKAAAQEMGFKIMVGCMASTSLAIYPAFLLAQDADFMDLDGALLLEHDRDGCDKPLLVY
jgi:L-alanine-DL-glutamate epimerase-like enolase superfamily enzyme